MTAVVRGRYRHQGEVSKCMVSKREGCVVDRSILMRRFTCFSLHFLRYFLIKTLFRKVFIL
ncbi:hypothetical protein RchiOBHm_Chr2g0120871 [Rosa chinensis]|uniref:Uncharacterized protein n=1 Tax=Rosa chinensis TaxID=74649 RepID=A0A2P6RSF4_ROSCH|nr:hypothetical protein RchiOBHm_Chr2g0120871 [Rosa chinensis]